MAKLIQPVATAAGYYFGGPLGAVIGSQVGGAAQNIAAKPNSPAAATAPTVSAPTVMPTADSEAVAATKKKSIIEQMANRGRASTILTDQTNDKLGG